MSDQIAIQDLYADRYSWCFGCGRLHESGFHVKSYWDGEETVCYFQPPAYYTGGWPEVMYGGVLASLVDCHSGATASATKAREMGLAEDAEVPRFVTASLKINLLAPTPAGAPLELRAKVRSLEGRKAWVDARVIADGQVTCTGETLMIQVRDQSSDTQQ